MRQPREATAEQHHQLDELTVPLPQGAAIADPDVIEAYRRDQARSVPAGHPLAVVRATATADVQAVMRWADRHRVPVVPRGAGSGLSGGAYALDGSIVLDLSSMDRIVEIDPVEQLAVVESGVINADVSRAAASHRLYYAPDPASWEFSTIGGNVATNAGGLCCVKYGVTGDHVLGLGRGGG